jgi:hypothetical protein
MRTALTPLALCALFAAHGVANAQSTTNRPGLRESEFQITPRVGVGELRIDQFVVGLSNDDSQRDTHGIGVGFGFLTPVGLVIEAGGDIFGDENLFDTQDSFNLRQEFISLGYQFELGDGWRFVPRVGRAHWKLRSEDGQFFDFDDDNDVREVRGNDYFYEASVSRRISRVVTLGLNVKQGNYDFGRTRSAAFLVTLGF